MALSGDVERFREFAKNKHLTNEDFLQRDMDILRGMARAIVPSRETREVNPQTDILETKIVPDFSDYPDEVSLIKLLKEKGKL